MGLFAEVKKWLSSWLLCVSLLSLALSLSSPGQALADKAAIKKLMTMSLEELMNVEISLPTRNPLPVHKAPAIATVITAREIRNMGARNLLDILRIVPGIGVSIAPIAVYHTIEVRGIKTLNSEKVLIMIDGHCLNEAMHSSSAFFWQYMSVEKIKRVEIIRGPGSALYGANAFTAVINIITKGADDINGLQVTAGGGSFDTRHSNVLFGHTGKKLKIAGTFDYLDTDGPSSFIERDAIGNSGNTLLWEKRPDFGLKIGYGDFVLQGGYLRNRMGPYIGAASALSTRSDQEWGQYWADLIYNRNLSKQFALKARLYGDEVNLNPFWELFPPGFTLGPFTYPDGLLGGPASKHRKIGIELTTDYSLAEHRLTTGILGEHIDQYEIDSYGNYNPLTYAPLPSYQPIAPFNQEVTRNIWALYIQDVWDIRANLSLTVGLRHDHYSDFGGTTNPRVGLVWEFMNNSSLKLLYGTAFRAPSFAELYHANNPSVIGNEDLKPEKIKTYEIALEHRFFDRYVLRLNYFHNNISDLIVTGPQPAPLTPAQYINQGKAKVEGIEAELKADFGADCYAFVNYSYQDPRDGDTDQRLPDVPWQRANAGVNLAPWQYLNANVTISWIGERPRADGDTRSDLSSATLVDLTLIAKNFFKTLEISGSAYNLFDADYRDPNPAPGTVPNDYPTNERMFMLELRYTL
jgi:outer membrane receptor for ferrienterochelin and colicin